MIMVGFGLMPLICRISSNRVRLLSKSRNKNKDLSRTPTFWVQTNLNLISCSSEMEKGSFGWTHWENALDSSSSLLLCNLCSTASLELQTSREILLLHRRSAELGWWYSMHEI